MVNYRYPSSIISSGWNLRTNVYKIRGKVGKDVEERANNTAKWHNQLTGGGDCPANELICYKG